MKYDVYVEGILTIKKCKTLDEAERWLRKFEHRPKTYIKEVA